MSYKHLLYEVEEEIATITINRPSSYNALSTETKVELGQAFQQADQDPNVRCIVITGAGQHSFCSGQDLNESQSLDESLAHQWVDEFDQLYQTIRAVKKPIIASINGYAVGSGLQLALLADIRISNEKAKYGMTEINVGLPCIIGSTLFWETMGKSKTIDLILTGRLLTAQEALEYDLITRIVSNEQLHKETQKLAKELAQKPPTAVRLNKKWFIDFSEEAYQRCIQRAKEAHTEAYASGEPQEMMKAFFEKRKNG